jgi:hypothetical protein
LEPGEQPRDGLLTISVFGTYDLALPQIKRVRLLKVEKENLRLTQSEQEQQKCQSQQASQSNQGIILTFGEYCLLDDHASYS